VREHQSYVLTVQVLGLLGESPFSGHSLSE